MAPSKEEKKNMLEFIDEYHNLPVLWKIKSREYSNKDLEDAGYDTLLVKYKEWHNDATKDDLKKKLNSMRTCFRRELKKLHCSQKSGAGAYDVYEPSLWYFDALIFLQDQETPAPSQFSIAEETLEIGDDDGTEIVDQDNTPIINPPNHTQRPGQVQKKADKHRKVVNQADELISLACHRLKEPGDEFLTLAKTWADELRKMDSQQQLFAKKNDQRCAV